MVEETQSDIAALTVQLLSAFVSNNNVPSEGLADLIKSTRAALTDDLASTTAEVAAPEHLPAVSIRKSLASPDHILSLVDGKPYKTLKRHLATNGLTPEQYRERYNLPQSYPMVAKSYSEARRAVAARLGLGKKPALVKATEPAETMAAPAPVGTSKTSAAARTKKAATTPAKRPPVKIKAVPAARSIASVAEAPKPAAVTPTAARNDGRKRLSIAGSKGVVPASKAAPAPASAEITPIKAEDKAAAKKPGTMSKAKSASKPKSLKAALKAAGSHLNADAKTEETAKAG
jgi:predicted transcriptional regulator